MLNKLDLSLDLEKLQKNTPNNLERQESILQPISQRIQQHRQQFYELKKNHEYNSNNDTINARLSAERAVGLMQGIVSNEADSPEEKKRKQLLPIDSISDLLHKNLLLGQEFAELNQEYNDVARAGNPMADLHEIHFNKFMNFLEECEHRFEKLAPLYELPSMDKPKPEPKREQRFTDIIHSKKTDFTSREESEETSFGEMIETRKNKGCCCIS